MLILMQTFINIAVNVSLFPVTGIPLPFVSQGGSSLVSLFMSLGILQSIVMRLAPIDRRRGLSDRESDRDRSCRECSYTPTRALPGADD
jgi:hypothetical protein